MGVISCLGFTAKRDRQKEREIEIERCPPARGGRDMQSFLVRPLKHGWQ